MGKGDFRDLISVVWNETEANFLIIYDGTQNYMKIKSSTWSDFTGVDETLRIKPLGSKEKISQQEVVTCVSLAFSIHSFIKIMVFVWRICVQCQFPFNGNQT